MNVVFVLDIDVKFKKLQCPQLRLVHLMCLGVACSLNKEETETDT